MTAPFMMVIPVDPSMLLLAKYLLLLMAYSPTARHLGSLLQIAAAAPPPLHIVRLESDILGEMHAMNPPLLRTVLQLVTPSARTVSGLRCILFSALVLGWTASRPAFTADSLPWTSLPSFRLTSTTTTIVVMLTTTFSTDRKSCTPPVVMVWNDIPNRPSTPTTPYPPNHSTSGLSSRH